MYSEIKFKFRENNLHFFEHSDTFWLLSLCNHDGAP